MRRGPPAPASSARPSSVPAAAVALTRTTLAALAAALIACGCASSPADAPKPITEADVRAKLTSAQTGNALRELKDERAREVLERHFEARLRDARRRGLQYTVERVLIGEDMSIGAGARLQRSFALAHEFDATTISSYLEAIELIGARVQQTLRVPVGQNGKQLATLEFVDLDRAALRTYRFAEQDPPCCPSLIVDTIYAWRGVTLEVVR